MTAIELNVKTNKATYSYKGYPIDHDKGWNDISGNYLFAANTNTGWKIFYAGITDSFADRIPNHPQIGAAKKLGATHTFARVNTDRTARENEEADIIGYFQPPLNKQLK